MARCLTRLVTILSRIRNETNTPEYISNIRLIQALTFTVHGKRPIEPEKK